MTLLEIRKRLIKATGRTDLVVDTQNYADDGADWYINAGKRFLDQQLPEEDAQAETQVSVSAGDVSVPIPDVRAVKNVRIQENGKEPQFLERYLLYDFIERWGDKTYLLNQADRGKPKRFTLGIIRTVQSGNISARDEQIILFHPKADASYDFSIISSHFTKTLESDSDVNYWSLVYPEVLILAARRAIEIDHRNQRGVQEFERQIRRRTTDIDSDQVSEEISGKSQMSNAW